jgi:hypothetical protein
MRFMRKELTLKQREIEFESSRRDKKHRSSNSIVMGHQDDLCNKFPEFFINFNL